ncbi:MAG: hypothetical protein PHG83_02075 [Patescibacteria group bacterium]|nr:hypothetical protein [Patescibacteria group bacterium]
MNRVGPTPTTATKKLRKKGGDMSAEQRKTCVKMMVLGIFEIILGVSLICIGGFEGARGYQQYFDYFSLHSLIEVMGIYGGAYIVGQGMRCVGRWYSRLIIGGG